MEEEVIGEAESLELLDAPMTLRHRAALKVSDPGSEEVYCFQQESPAILVLSDAKADALAQVEEQLFLWKRAKVVARFVTLQADIHKLARILCRSFCE
jgi:hypothetical protein